MHVAIEEIYKSILVRYHIRYLAQTNELADGIRVVLQCYQWDVHGTEIWSSFITFRDGDIDAQWNVKREWR